MIKKSRRTLVALTMGDPSGISTEITLKAWKSKKSKSPFFLIHDPQYVQKIIKRMDINVKIKVIKHPNETFKYYKKYLPILAIKINSLTRLGKPNRKNAKSIMDSINKAVSIVDSGNASSIVTNPISKEIINKIQRNFRGHTEYLAKKDKKKNFCMMMVNNQTKIIPLTTHVPLKDVSKNISQKLIFDTVVLINNSLKKDFSTRKPTIAVTGLNPHSGDHGVIGLEEKKIIVPAIRKCRSKKINISGPLSADSAFRKNNLKKFDAFLCMYHDQALIPAKVIDFENTINYTVGLSYVRTSPDHGTGFDIADKFIASEASLISAINTSVLVSKNR